MKKISYDEIRKNTRLTDFSGIKEMVLANQVKNVPNGLKEAKTSYDKELGYFG